MENGNRLDAAFKRLRNKFTAQTKKSFLRDIRGQIDDDENIQRILNKPNTSKYVAKYVAVTFDRKKKDSDFSYGHFDLVLVALDAISGGKGIYKPLNQMRALRWNGTRADLLRVLRYFAKNNAEIRFRRVLILPYPPTPTGKRIDSKIYLK